MKVVRTGFLSLAMWVLVVAGGSTFAWVAIDHAGRDLVSADAGSVADDTPTLAAPAPILPILASSTQESTSPSSTSALAALPRATTTGSHPATGSPSSPSRATVTSPSSTTPTQKSTPSSARPDRPARPGGGATPPSAPVTPSRVITSASGAAGAITAVCQGQRLAIRSANPRDGWALRLVRRDQVVGVTFHRVGNDRTGFVVFAGCVDGTPRLVSTPRGVSVAAPDVRHILNTTAFPDIAGRLGWRAPFGVVG